MDAKVFGLIELLVFFGGALAFCYYQVWSIRKLRREDAEKRAAGIDPDAPLADGKKKPEDIFWDTVTRVPPKKD